MKQFDLYEPTTLSEATGLLNQFGAKAKVVAGGSDLLGGVMKDWVQGKGMPYPEQVIDITTIPNLGAINVAADGPRRTGHHQCRLQRSGHLDHRHADHP